MPAPDSVFDAQCRRCPRLAAHLAEVRARYPAYHAAPVPAFGAALPRLLIVGLAPGLHGANATGRPFTGDYAGILLYETLHRYGYSNQPHATARDDGLVLYGCRITNAVKCLPPENKPVGEEVRNCNVYLKQELASLPAETVVMALGSIAHGAVLRAAGVRLSAYPFAHGALHTLPSGRRLIDSYHCSRYNTQTRRLTPQMFAEVFERVNELLSARE
ncbi:uracil-DNA glycosylase [Ectothiorhodospiraceae bacterium 2226]|nr:uracil-DNA glycosylase [Ectothiorhodospiraceae bacterium 2226]